MIVRQFKIYPDNHWLDFTVKVHHNKAAMHKANAEVMPDFKAIFRGFVIVRVPAASSRRKEHYESCIGEIHFYRGAVGVGIVSHECTHAAYAYFKFRNGEAGLPEFSSESIGKYTPDKEEFMCWVVGNLASQFYCNYYAKRTPRYFRMRCPFEPVTFHQARKSL